jgi:hypothetical protein
MPIQREGNFLVTHDLGITSSVGIESERLSECIKEARSFQGVFGSPSFGFRQRDFEFLRDLRHLRQVWFWDCEFASIDGIYALQDLEYCGVMEKRPGIDYSRFPRLKTVVSRWNTNDTGIDTSTIRKFYFWHYKPRSKSFEGALFPPEVEELELNWVNPSSLTGVSPLPKLRELGIHRSRNMEDLSMLPVVAPNLKKLIVTSSKRVTHFEGIEDHPSIELAIIDGKRIKG